MQQDNDYSNHASKLGAFNGKNGELDDKKEEENEKDGRIENNVYMVLNELMD
jgi:hypothetical protein